MQLPGPDELLERVRALPAAPALLERLGDRGGVYLVGGAVRDLLLGLSSTDLDLVVEGDVSALVASLGGEIRMHDRFGTATVNVGGHLYDVVRARRERYAHPGALPDVEPASLDEDLLRRDFTVNALALELAGPGAGTLRRVPNAIEDLAERQLRVLHDRSFIDDPTRLLRLLRYQSRLRFTVEPHTDALARAAIADGALGTVSGPRIGAELRLLAREPDPVAAIAALGSLDLELTPGFGLRDPGPARGALALLPRDGDRAALVIGAAATGVPAGALGPWLDELAFDAATRATIVAVATRARALAATLRGAETGAAINAAAGDAGAEAVALAGALGAERQARAWLERLRHVRLEIDGGDLLDAGIEEGPAIGRGLRAALDAKLDGRVVDRDDELAEALRAAR